MMNNQSVRKNEDNYCCYRKTTSGDIRIIWEITNKCNLDCSHCFVDRKDNTPILTTDECYTVIDDFKHMPIAKVMFTGGEPFIRNDLFQLIERVKSIDSSIIVDITTNFSLLTPDKIDKLKDYGVDELTTSIDGTDITHDSIRKSSGNYHHILKTLQLLKAKGIDVDVVTVLNKLNHRIIEETIDQIYSSGFSSLSISGLINKGGICDKEQLAALSLNADELKESYDRIMAKRDKYKEIFPIRTVGLYNKLNGDMCSIQNIISIDYKGDAYRCLLTSDKPPVVYNMKQQRLSEIYKDITNRRCYL